MASISTLKDQKAALRRSMQAQLKELAADDIATQSSAVAARIFQLPLYKQANAMSIYLSMPDTELATREIVLQALKDGKRIFVPYIHKRPNAQSQEIDMLELVSREDLESLLPNAWGIPSLAKDSIAGRRNALGGFGIEGNENERLLAPALNLVFVPGVAFDRGYGRLGHGKGFYDRYLERYKKACSMAAGDSEMPVLVALALKQQILPEGEVVPTSDDDWRVDHIVVSKE